MNSNPRRSLVWFCLCFLLVLARLVAAAGVAPQERIVMLVSIDAFRWDYMEKYHATNLMKLALDGVRAERMIPMFPSMTFPNHHTIMTGWRPARHGVIHNNIYDPTTKETFAFNKTELQGSQWWGGEPVWATAIKQGRRADCALWPGTGIKMANTLPTEAQPFEYKYEPDQVVDLGLNWLDQPAEKRASFIALYFHHVDSVGHKHGTDSAGVATAVGQVDAAIGRLVAGIRRLKLEDKVNLVIVSDHGMTDISPDRTVALGDFLDFKKMQVDFSGALAGLRPKDGDVAALFKLCQEHENHFKTYRAENMPADFHFTKNPRIPPIILLADDGWYVAKRASGEAPTREMNKATHGYDPRLSSMGASFIAWGAAFQHGVTLAPFENVHIYNLLCATMGLKPAPNDGDEQLVKKVLAK